MLLAEAVQWQMERSDGWFLNRKADNIINDGGYICEVRDWPQCKFTILYNFIITLYII